VKRRSSVLLGAALLSSCSPPIIEVAVSGSGAQSTVTLSQDWGIIFSDRKAPCVWQVSLVPDGARQDQPVWRIEPVREVQCLDLGSFTIGVAPAGFRETVRLSNPPHGNYTIVVLGIGSAYETVSL
jgi:hypothetical protein